MKIVVDTNIVLDMLGRREPFFEQSQLVIQLIAEGKVDGGVTANAITDIYYILRKHLNKDVLKAALRGLMELLEIIAVTSDECLAALDLPINDYEDSLLSCCARSWKADYIVTRNVKDFTHSPVKTITPADFLKIIQSE